MVYIQDGQMNNCWMYVVLAKIPNLGHKTSANVNILRPRRNEQHFADHIFKRIFFNENVWTSIKISLKFVPKGPINNIPALVQIMAWRRPGDKPLSEPMMVRSTTHICVTRPQWVKTDILNGLWAHDSTLHWRHNEHDGVSNHQPHDSLLNRLFRRRSKKTSKLRVTGLCAGNSPVTGEFPALRASNAENVSIWWRHHEIV